MPDTPTVIVHLYQSRRPLGRQKWRWNARSGNGEILCQGESYANRGDLIDTLDKLFRDSDVWLRQPGHDDQVLRVGNEEE